MIKSVKPIMMEEDHGLLTPGCVVEMMAEYSEPKFLSFKQMNEINKSKIKATAICQCPLPCAAEINGIMGGYCHVVEYDKKYVCKKCGTEFSAGKHFG